jgi:hypothetical protein
MKKLFFIIIAIQFFSCTSEKENSYKGYYYSMVDSEIFHFQNKKLTIYNIMDSTSTSYKTLYDVEKINIDAVDYKIKNFGKDSLTLYDFDHNNIDLVKFKFNEFEVKELNDSNWSSSYIDGKGSRINQFIKIKDQNGFHFFSSNVKNLKDTLYIHETPFIGKFFNKFNVYSLYNVFLIYNYNNKNISFMRFENNERRNAETYLMEKVLPKKINIKAIGKWHKIGDSINLYSITYRKYLYKLKETDKNYNRKIDSIKQLLDYSKIEFTNNQSFIRFLKNDSIQIIYDINNTPVSNYLFINNPDFENQYFEIKKITKDSLTIKISEPNFLYTYVRDSI